MKRVYENWFKCTRHKTFYNLGQFLIKILYTELHVYRTSGAQYRDWDMIKRHTTFKTHKGVIPNLWVINNLLLASFRCMPTPCAFIVAIYKWMSQGYIQDTVVNPQCLSHQQNSIKTGFVDLLATIRHLIDPHPTKRY